MNDFFQQKRPLKDLGKKEIAFAVISVVSSVLAIGIAIQRLATTSKGDPDFTFALIIIVNACKSKKHYFSSFFIILVFVVQF